MLTNRVMVDFPHPIPSSLPHSPIYSVAAPRKQVNKRRLVRDIDLGDRLAEGASFSAFECIGVPLAIRNDSRCLGPMVPDILQDRLAAETMAGDRLWRWRAGNLHGTGHSLVTEANDSQRPIWVIIIG